MNLKTCINSVCPTRVVQSKHRPYIYAIYFLGRPLFFFSPINLMSFSGGTVSICCQRARARTCLHTLLSRNARQVHAKYTQGVWSSLCSSVTSYTSLTVLAKLCQFRRPSCLLSLGSFCTAMYMATLNPVKLHVTQSLAEASPPKQP